MSVTLINPADHHEPLGRYSHVAISEGGRFAFIAGQVSVDRNGQIVAPNDLGGQIPVVFDNLAKVVTSLGAGLRSVVQLTTYVVGAESREIWHQHRLPTYEKHFGDGPMPPNTLLFISGLADPAMLLEVSAIVRLPD